MKFWHLSVGIKDEEVPAEWISKIKKAFFPNIPDKAILELPRIMHDQRQFVAEAK